jgi:predicted ATPase
VKAGLFSAAGRASDDVEALLIKSKEIARFQKARSWELRTTCDLARIWQSQTRVGEALNSLLEIYNQFTEGFETADLQAAGALLKSLATNSIPCASEPLRQENSSIQGPVDNSAA